MSPLKSAFVAGYAMDPISHKPIDFPVFTPCNHVFEDEEIRAWINPVEHARMKNETTEKCCVVYQYTELKEKGNSTGSGQCPLCKKFLTIGSLSTYNLMKKALEILNDPRNASAENITDLTDDEQHDITQCQRQILGIRASNKEQGFSDQLEPSQSIRT